MSHLPKTKVHIKDVARACGVSTQTISRVINNRSDVSNATRERVQAVIDQMGYQPSALARSMRQGSRLIGVIITGRQFKGISTTLHSIALAAQKNNYSIVVKDLVEFDSTDIQPSIQSLTAHQVQGIIYAAPEVGNNWVVAQEAITSQTPSLVFLKGNPSSAQVTVSIDNYNGAYQITKHLIEKGYKRIAHVSGPLSWWESRERVRGWRQAMEDYNLEITEHSLIEGDWSIATGVHCFKQLHQNYSEMDAIFAGNDQTAFGILHCAWKMGIRVPEQLAVAGYDNLPESEYYNPPLTTINQDFPQLGELAVNKLLKKDKHHKSDQMFAGDSIIIKPQLVVRSST